MRGKFDKFIPFAKVDEAKREVWGIVTAEVPDKDNEVCDYAGTVPYYRAVIAEMSKATDGENFFPLRYMHQLKAVGKCVGFDFRDQDKEIFMGFKVTDDDTWNQVTEKVLTGFSHGGSLVGSMVPDPVYEGCQRYIADPSEISVVDNPCLATAHFTMIRADGAIELCKFKRVVAIDAGVKELTALKARVAALEGRTRVAKGKTKRIAGEDLPASAFLIVLDANDTSTWNLPVEFSTEAKSKRHVRNALARFGQLKSVPQEAKDAAWNKLVALAEKFDIDVKEEKAKLAAIHSYIRKAIRSKVNGMSRKVRGGNVGPALAGVDFDLGRIQKGMYEVGRLACLVQDLDCMLYCVCAEQEWEGDENSPLPDLLAANVNELLDTLLQMVEEEAQELRDDMSMRTA